MVADAQPRPTAAEVLALLEQVDGPVAVVGSLNADLTVKVERHPSPGETVAGGPLAVLPGGKSANQAAAAGRLGARVTIVGALGDDGNAAVLREALTDAGVDIGQVATVPETTGTAVITVSRDGENTIVISAGANGTLTSRTVHEHAESITGARALGLVLEVPMAAVLAAARIAHEAGVPVLTNLSPSQAVPDELLELTDVLVVNEHELGDLLGADTVTEDWAATQKALHDKGIDRAVVTLGSKGAVVLDGQVTPVPATEVDVVDTTGSGDSFMGSLLAGTASGLSLTDSASLAAVVSALAATKDGAMSSYAGRDEVRAFLEQQ